MTTIATECPVCPKGIVACTHFDDMVVWLVDLDEAIAHTFPWLGERWQAIGPGTPDDSCGCGVKHITMEGSYTITDSLPDAEAEYERRCALLRAEA